MSSLPLGIRLQHIVITDFVQTFERDLGLNINSCSNIVEDNNSIFHSFSYLILHLFTLIDSFYNYSTLTFKGLPPDVINSFYQELYKVGINFTINRYYNDIQNECTDIVINTFNIWSIPDFRITPQLQIYQTAFNIFNAFYSSIDNLSSTYHTNYNRYIIVTMPDFIKFKRIYRHAYNSITINNDNIINNIVNLPNQPPSIIQSNNDIKHQLADLIFDIKNDLSDAMYKDILEKIALISP